MTKSKRSRYELKKLSDIWIDIGKILFASVVIPIFFADFNLLSKTVIAVVGLTLTIFCAKVGLEFAKYVKD